MPKYFRRVIKIPATSSPNVRLALAEIAAGKAPSGRILVPGVIDYEEYLRRRATWDKVRQTIGLDALFYEGAETLMFPPEWLNLSAQAHEKLRGRRRVTAGIGIDTGEGEANTAYVAVDELGIVEMMSRKTPDTSIIVDEAIAFIKKHQVPAHRVAFDRGGGGKQIADMVRKRGYMVRTIAFGSAVVREPKRMEILPPRGAPAYRERKESIETRYEYVNRRGQMYGELREMIDPYNPDREGPPFAIPVEYVDLRRQLSPIPLLRDPEGRLFIPPKNRRPGQKEGSGNTVTLVELIGHSPDEADALVLALHCLLHEEKPPVVGPAWK